MGILEEILETNKQILAALTAGGGNGASSKSSDTKTTTTKTTKPKIKPQDLTDLVQPLAHDPATKSKVKDVLSSFGLSRLGEHTEDQRQALYDAFKEIADASAEEVPEEDDDGLL